MSSLDARAAGAAPDAGWPEAELPRAPGFWQRFARRKVPLLCLLYVAAIAALAIAAPLLPLADPNAIDSPRRLLPPGEEGFLLGSDEFGRDVLSRLIWGGRVSLSAGFGAALLAMAIGGLIGLLAGFFRGWIDAALMRLTDIVLAFPSILLAIAVVAALGPSLANAMLAVAISGFPLYARVVRGSVLSVRELDYMEAARALGATDRRMIFRHILPNVTAPVIVAFSLDVGLMIVVTASLGFLGLGAQPPLADWGSMIASGRSYIYSALHLLLLPGLAIFSVALSLNVVGDHLRDLLDPRLRQG